MSDALEMRVATLGARETLIDDTDWRQCPRCTMSAIYQVGIWQLRPGGVHNEIDLIGYDRRCFNGHDWRSTVLP